MSAGPDFADISLTRPDAVLHGIRLGNDPRVLLLHAGGEHAGVFRPVMQRLHAAGIDSIAYDQRGHGRSREARNASLPPLAEDARAMIESMNQPLVAGCSLGGLALLEALADQHTQARASGLALLDIIPDPAVEHVRPYLSGALGAGADNPIINHILSLAPQLRESCRQLNLPVLLIRAGQDTPLDDDGEQRFLKLVPHAASTTIDEAGQLVAQTAPAQLADILISFAGRVLEASPGADGTQMRENQNEH